MDEREIVLTIRDFKEILNQLLRQIDALEERVEILEQKNN
jgi:regulator of replication initiation timing